ncbi:MAG: hypothetical protein ACJ8DI_03270 [Ktedonobacteraceae bacterium]
MAESKNVGEFLKRIPLDVFAAERGLPYDFIHEGMTLLNLFDADISGRDFEHGKPHDLPRRRGGERSERGPAGPGDHSLRAGGGGDSQREGSNYGEADRRPTARAWRGRGAGSALRRQAVGRVPRLRRNPDPDPRPAGGRRDLGKYA